MKFALKKKGNYNVIVTWLYYVISFVITLNHILLSLPIAFTYHFVPDGSLLTVCPFNIPYLIYLFIGNWLFFITLLKCSQPSSLLFSYYLLIYWKTIFFNLILLRTGSPLIVLQLQTDDWVTYRSTPARSVALYKALNLWNHHIGSESTTC